MGEVVPERGIHFHVETLDGLMEADFVGIPQRLNKLPGQLRTGLLQRVSRGRISPLHYK